MQIKPVLRHLVVGLWAALALSSTAAATDWNAASVEALDKLQSYLRVDTSNPPGNETPAAELLQSWLSSEGIETKLYDPMGNPQRQALVARLPGKSGKTLVLMSHSDVVPAVVADWKHPPFAAEVHDGVLYGRGALDTKGLGILQVMTLLLMHRGGFVPDDTIVLLIEPDEEVDGGGIHGMLKQHAAVFGDVRMVLNEGGQGTIGLLKPEQVIFFVQTAEKGAAWMKLKVHGDAGHGSVPLRNNAVVAMARALDKVSRYETPLRPPATVLRLFQGLAEQASFPDSFVMNHLDSAIVRGLAGGKLTERPMVNALLRTTISLTGMKGGYKTNVIPSDVEATLDCRVVPGDSSAALRAELTRVIDDPRVQIEMLNDGTPSESPVDDDLMNAIRAAVAPQFPGAVVAPFMSSGGTDSAPFRELGTKAYGFNPLVATEAEMSTMHGIDERIGVERLRQALQIHYETIASLVRHAKENR